MNILIVIFALINAQEGKLMDSCLVFSKKRTWNIRTKDHLSYLPTLHNTGGHQVRKNEACEGDFLSGNFKFDD